MVRRYNSSTLGIRVYQFSVNIERQVDIKTQYSICILVKLIVLLSIYFSLKRVKELHVVVYFCLVQ